MKICKEIELSNELDSDRELEIFITKHDIDCSVWIDQEKAVQIIEHLSNLFGVKQ